MSSSEHVSIRVNSTRLPQFVGKTVRLPCKFLKFDNDNAAVVEASDGGQVRLTWVGDSKLADTYVEVIGQAVDASTIKMMACLNLGSDLDMKIVNDTIELMHDPRFYSKMFT